MKGKKQDGESQTTGQTLKKLSHFMWHLVYTDNFFMWQFLFAQKTNTPAFQQMQFKIGHFSSSTRANKNWHIKIARVDGALITKTTTLHVYYTFYYISLPSVHD